MKINKKLMIGLVGVFFLICISFVSVYSFTKKSSAKTNSKKMEATVLAIDDEYVTVQDKQHVIYTFNLKEAKADIGDSILIEYTGLLDKTKVLQKNSIIKYTTSTVSMDEDGIPVNYLDNGIFKNYYILAYDKLSKLTLDEKIGQLLLVRYPDSNAIEALKKYKFGGYIFFERDFKNKTKQEVKNMIKSLQQNANIPLLTAVDEEGGKVVRVSSNPNLAKEKFKSSQELYNLGGLDQIKTDTIEKSKLLNNLGLNLNLAPVVDVTTDPNAYMYERSLGKNTQLTSDYAKTVIEASKGTGVSYSLKHFPGYGNNADTHTSGSVDQRTYDEILKNDLPPFQAGITVGAEAVLVSHNTVTNIDSSNPASLSTSVHNLLRNELAFTGIIITDDLAMGAVSSIPNATVKAITSGNDIIITTDFEASFNSIKSAIQDGSIGEDLIDKLAFRVLAWKYYKGIMFEHQK